MKNQTVHLTLSMSDETKKRLKYYAIQKNSTVSKLISEWIWSIEVKAPNDERGGENNAKSTQS